MPKPIVVIGSANIDLTCRTPRLPLPGQTVGGSDFQALPGGKGANQAVAAARLGGNVHFVGRVGNDSFGIALRDSLMHDRVVIDRLVTTSGVPTGCALIVVEASGQNSIVVVPGANGALTPADVDSAETLLATADCCVLQLEVPIETALHAIALCRRLGVRTILDPAPVPSGGMPDELFDVDLLTPNQTEAEMLLGRPDSPEATARALLARGARCVVLKLGDQGALYADADRMVRQPAFLIEPVDTTAAGDAFTGALALAWSEDQTIEEMLRFANAAGALCCRKAGAQPAMPTREELSDFLMTK